MTRNPKVGYGRLVGVMINGSAALEGVWKSHERQEKELRISSLRQLRPLQTKSLFQRLSSDNV